MSHIVEHLRNKLLAGALAAGPLVVVAWAAWWVENQTRPLTEILLGRYVPGLGVLIALVLVYLLGIAVTSLLGRLALTFADRVLSKIPGFSFLYRTWKDVLVVAPDRAGMFHQVVLVPSATDSGAQIGFTSGDPLPADPDSICVFVPGVPNPIAGRLVLIRRDRCLPTGLSVDNAFKFLLSNGNYLPTELQPTAAIHHKATKDTTASPL
jgi:uncharacterized membrane protein